VFRPFRDGSAVAGPSRFFFFASLLLVSCAGGPPRPDPALSEVWAEYEKLPSQRALAVAGVLRQGRWVMGASGGHVTAAAAAESALRECRSRRAEQRTPAACRIYALGDEIVWEAP
jgi:hypothetical protein